MAGIRIADNKRVMVGNRVRRRLRATGIASFAEYYAFLTSPAGAGEMPLFLDEITTNETYFFRDIQHYQWLGDDVPPRDRPAWPRCGSGRGRLRIWSAACSTGEEPYSMAIEDPGASRPMFAGWRITILGTDLSGAVLAEARAGRYDARAVRLVEPAQRPAFFDEDPAAERWTVKPDVKALVTWKLHNLLSPLERGAVRLHLHQERADLFRQGFQAGRREEPASRRWPRAGTSSSGPTEGIYNMLDPLTSSEALAVSEARRD